MGRILLRIILAVVVAVMVMGNGSVFAQTPPPAAQTPLSCGIVPSLGNCPKDLPEIYSKSKYYKGEKCVPTYEEFIKNPVINHFWAVDEGITSQGKANERARQFLYWVMSKSAIDQHPVIRQIWNTTQGVVLFLFMLVAALFGLVYIVGQRSDFQVKMQIWPIMYKIGAGLLYIVFSYAIIMSFIQISEIIMKFFIESLGGDKLFNIYFTGAESKEDSYATFVGCRDLNYKVQEAIEAEVMLMKITNITYYVMGVMILLRKILLWFLLFASPFLALLMPFVFIRNTGWIWIGVFFQWVFYGPLFALFLGSLTKIWQNGIPFPFDFSRVAQVSGYIYPTGINIVYGGPAQVGSQIISALNNGNYVDTFAEYVISLIMLWAVIFFPWWLLRIFRDYCCDGIMAMKNVLMSMYDRMAPPPKSPPPAPAPRPTSTGTAMKLPHEVEVPVKVRLETINEIRQTKTEDITKSLNLKMSKITDIAKFETNKQTHETVTKNIDMLTQPTKATTPAERQKFMNIRTELFNRTIKDDKVARQVLSSISSSQIEMKTRKEEILRTVPRVAPAVQAVGYKVNISNEKVSSINTAVVKNVTANSSIMQSVAQATKAPAEQISSVLSSYKTNIAKAPSQIVSSITTETGIATDTIKSIIKAVSEAVKKNKEVVKKIAEEEQVKEDVVQNVLTTQTPLVAEPEKNIEQSVTIPPSVSIEDYEEVKKMWTQQYEKGEVPTSENITSREQWVEQDTVFITNTLNKLLSTDDKLRQEGIDDLAYILPVFLINSLKGEELVVYLKAKLEAAKAVKRDMDKEREITEKLKKKADQEEEELVEVKKEKKEEAKTMEMSQELPAQEDSKPIEGESTPSETESGAPQNPAV